MYLNKSFIFPLGVVNYLLNLVWFGLFVLWHTKLRGLLNAKYIFVEKRWKDKMVHTILKCTSPKLNIIERLEFEHTSISSQ